jgi:chromosome segregation ATPase
VDLEVVAARALAAVKALLEDVEEAEKGIDAEGERIQEARHHIEGEATRTCTALRELAALAEESRQSVEREGQESLATLDGLSRRIATVHAEAAEALDASRVEAAALGGRVASLTPRMGALFDRLETAAQALRAVADQAETQVETAVTAAHTIQTLAAGDFHRFEEALDDRLEELQRGVEEACVPTLQTLAETWSESLEGMVANTVARGFSTAAANLAEVSPEALSLCRKGCAPLLEEVAALGGRLDGALDRLAGAVERGAAVLADGGPSLESLRATEGGIESARAALERVKATLASYTFVTL